MFAARIITTILGLFALIFYPSDPSAVGTKIGKPVIQKLGTIDCDLVEVTPIVFQDRLYRFEYIRNNYKSNQTGKSYFRFLDVMKNEPMPAFAAGFHLGSAYAQDDTMYVFGVPQWGGIRIQVFWSKDLIHWESQIALDLPGWKIFNTSVCRDSNGYVMAFEIDAPPEETGKGFTMRFAVSYDLLTWKLTPSACVYTKDRYSACPAIRFVEGWYYMVYLEAYSGPKYLPHIVRSPDLIHWERSPYNPILQFSDEDKKIANPALTSEQKEAIAKAENLNNSDVDFCEYLGKVVILYSWGNQKGTEFLAEARYDGSLKDFLQGYFPVRRLLYNSDGTNVFIHTPPPITPQQVQAHVDEVANTQVDTFLICPNAGQEFYYPSRVGNLLGAGLSVDREAAVQKKAAEKEYSLEKAVVNLKALVDAGHDPLGLIIDQSKKYGLETFISFRLNEVHDVDKPDSLLLSEFWRNHPEWRVGGNGWLGQALNFAIPEVRARRMAELLECCTRYDIDGLELDFQRFPSYFPPGKGTESTAIMTDWVREVRRMVKEIEQKRGRSFLLAARVPTTLEECRKLGLDPETWVKEGLLDFLTVSEFLHTRFDMPIQAVKDQITEIPIYADIEYSKIENGKPVPMVPEDYRRAAKSLWEKGVNGILLFNFFCSREENPPKEPLFFLLNELGDRKTIK